MSISLLSCVYSQVCTHQQTFLICQKSGVAVKKTFKEVIDWLGILRFPVWILFQWKENNFEGLNRFYLFCLVIFSNEFLFINLKQAGISEMTREELKYQGK